MRTRFIDRRAGDIHDLTGLEDRHRDRVAGLEAGELILGDAEFLEDMTGFGAALSDEEIWAVLAYIKSYWPSEIRKAQHEMTRERDRR